MLTFAVSLLAEDKPLPEKNHDHALGGDWRDHRECHLKPDLLLIYRKPDVQVLGDRDHDLISRFSPAWFKIDPKHGRNSA